MSIFLSVFALIICMEANAQTITHTTSDKGDFEDINPDKSLGNPLHLPIFAPDPSARVWDDGRLYVYPSRDTPGQESFYTGMDRWYVFSSENLVDWTNHGLIFHVDDIPWADYKAWAPDCAYRDGKYYFYFPVQDYNDENWIGVATSDSPTGPISALHF